MVDDDEGSEQPKDERIDKVHDMFLCFRSMFNVLHGQPRTSNIVSRTVNSFLRIVGLSAPGFVAAPQLRPG